MDNPFREYLDGDDVKTAVGLMRMDGNGTLDMVAHVLVDYGDSKFYVDFFEKDWERDHAFNSGFLFRRLADDKLRVESLSQFGASCEKEGETHVLSGPCFYTDCNSVKPDIDRFIETAEKVGIWILHLMAGKHSYISSVVWPDGRVVWRHKRDRVNIVITDERRNP